MAEAHREEIAKLEALYAAHPEGRVFTHLAEAYRRAGELGRAREILEDGLRRHPDYSSAHVVYGRVLMDLDDAEAAASAFRRVLDLDRHNLVALRSLGDLAEKAGDRPAAIGYYRDLIALDPGDDRLRLTVARLEQQLAAGAAAAEPEPETAAEPVGEAAPWHTADAAGPAETAAAESPDAEGAADEEALPSFPMLDDGGEGEPFAFESGTLEVEGLSLSWDAEAAPSDVARPEGFMTEEPAASQEIPSGGAGERVAGDEGGSAEGPMPEETPVDAAMASPGLLPDAFAGMGWTAGDRTDAGADEDRAESETSPFGDEPLAADDTAWASLGERAEAAWSSPAGADEEPPAGDEIEEIRTWGPPLEEGVSGEALHADAAPAGAGAGDSDYETVESAADERAPEEPPEPMYLVVEETTLHLEEAIEYVEPPTLRQPRPEATSPEGVTGEMLTATMAELYAQQGFYDRAVDVYRQLLEQVPEDERLRERLAEVELLGRAAMAAGGEAEESEAEAASVWTGTSGVAGSEETPYAWAGSAPGEEGSDAGATAGSYFRSLLSWQPGGPAAAGASAAEMLELTADEQVAGRGATDAAAVELEAGAVAAAFEEWFGDEPDARGESETGEAADEEDADLAMFRSWLQSLKK